MFLVHKILVHHVFYVVLPLHTYPSFLTRIHHLIPTPTHFFHPSLSLSLSISLSLTRSLSLSLSLPGIGASVLFYLADLAFSDKTAPFLISCDRQQDGIDGKKTQK